MNGILISKESLEKKSVCEGIRFTIATPDNLQRMIEIIKIAHKGTFPSYLDVEEYLKVADILGMGAKVVYIDCTMLKPRIKTDGSDIRTSIPIAIEQSDDSNLIVMDCPNKRYEKLTYHQIAKKYYPSEQP